MSAPSWNNPGAAGFGRDERDLELLAAYALGAIEPAEEADVERLLAQGGRELLESFELAAAAATLATAQREGTEQMPASLRAKLHTSADRWNRSNPAPAPRQRLAPAPDRSADPGPMRFAAWTGWVAAAAALALAAVAWMPIGSVVRPASPGAADNGWLRAEPGMSQDALSRVRSELIVREGDTVLASWTPTEQPDPTASSAAGDLIWSTETQCGVMRFEGLASNNPEEFQYQLWIFDENQKHPIDGGVFDVPPDGSGQVFIPVNPKISVDKPTMFAVTVEKPGGVVVSDQSRIALLAPALKPISECEPGEIAGSRGSAG